MKDLFKKKRKTEEQIYNSLTTEEKIKYWEKEIASLKNTMWLAKKRKKELEIGIVN